MNQIKHLPYEIDERTNRFHFYEQYWKHRALELLERHTRLEGLVVLDYGCGRGEALQLFGSHGAQIIGVDPDPKCVELASKYGESKILYGSSPLEMFEPGSFDVVLSLHVLEHVENPKQVLTDLGRLARRYVLVAVPNLKQLQGLFRRSIDVNEVNSGHLQSWDHGHFQNLAERHCDLKLVEWISDATILAGLSPFLARFFGTRAAISFETGIFRSMFPFFSVSVIGLFAPTSDDWQETQKRSISASVESG